MIEQDSKIRTLRYSLLSTKVGALLDTYKGPALLTTRDKETLESARDFLLSALEGQGQRLTGAMEVGEKALEDSEAYGGTIDAAVELLNEGVTLPEDQHVVRKFIHDLTSTLEGLQAVQKPGEAKLDILRHFFRALRTVTLAEVTEPIEQVSIERPMPRISGTK